MPGRLNNRASIGLRTSRSAKAFPGEDPERGNEPAPAQPLSSTGCSPRDARRASVNSAQLIPTVRRKDSCACTAETLRPTSRSSRRSTRAYIPKTGP